jgi:hypothetical protein
MVSFWISLVHSRIRTRRMTQLTAFKPTRAASIPAVSEDSALKDA